jgi:hypothetical protein
MSFGRQSQGIWEGTDEVLSVNAITPQQFNTVLEWSNDSPVPVDLQVEVTSPGSSSGFPSDVLRNFFAGSYLPGLTPYISEGPCAVMKVEFGGLQPRTVFADLANGRFSIGAQESVRVSFARWMGGVEDPLPLRVRASVAPGSGDSELLRYTAYLSLDSGNSYGFEVPVPPGARYGDVYVNPSQSQDFGTATAPVIECSTAFAAVRDYTSGTYYPPTGPLPILGTDASATLALVINNITANNCKAYAVFWVQ